MNAKVLTFLLICQLITCFVVAAVIQKDSFFIIVLVVLFTISSQRAVAAWREPE